MQPLEARFLPFRGLGRFMATSKLSRLECRVKPLRENNTSLLALYDAFFTSSEIELFDLTADVIEKATDLRASLNFKTPDSLHLATKTYLDVPKSPLRFSDFRIFPLNEIGCMFRRPQVRLGFVFGPSRWDSISCCGVAFPG